MRIGILDGVMRKRDEDTGWDDLYRLAKDLGFEGMELGVFGGYDQTQLWSEEGRRHLVEIAKSVGIETPSICIHSYWKYSFASDDEAIRARAGRIAAEAAEAAAGMEAVNILIPLTCPKEVGEETAAERWIEGMKASAPAAEKAGVVFCLENVGQAFAYRPEDIAAIVDRIDSPAVQVYYDPGNSVHKELDPVAGIDVLGSRIKHVHVKDVGGTYLGEGTVPWPALLAKFGEIGYDGWLIFETSSTDDPRKAAGKNLEVMRSMIG